MSAEKPVKLDGGPLMKYSQKQKDGGDGDKAPQPPQRPAKVKVVNAPDVENLFLLFRRRRTSIYLGANVDTTVLEMRRRVAGIMKRRPADVGFLLNGAYVPDEVDHTPLRLGAVGITEVTAPFFRPFQIGLCLMDESGVFDQPDIVEIKEPERDAFGFPKGAVRGVPPKK